MMALLELAETKSVAGSNLSKKVTDGGNVGTCPLGGGHLKGKGCSHVCVLKRRFFVYKCLLFWFDTLRYCSQKVIILLAPFGIAVNKPTRVSQVLL